MGKTSGAERLGEAAAAANEFEFTPYRFTAVRTWTPPVGQAIADGDMKVGL
jgi:hypothetical protein